MEDTCFECLENLCRDCPNKKRITPYSFWKPTLQTKFGPEEGNCLAACIATMFPVDIDDVPDFGDDKDAWQGNFSSWVKEHLGMFFVSVKANPAEEQSLLPSLFQGQRVITTIDNGSCRHAVITRDSRIVFDPDPEVGLLGGRELTDKDDATFYVFSPLNVRWHHAK